MYKIHVPHTVPGKPDATLTVNDYPLKIIFYCQLLFRLLSVMCTLLTDVDVCLFIKRSLNMLSLYYALILILIV